MLDKSVPVYGGEGFEVCTRFPIYDFKDMWEKGAIVERKMPMPTIKKPDRFKTVYYWIGEDSAWFRGLSAEMPASVTVKNAEGSFVHRMIVRAWKPQLVIRPVMVPA